MEFLNFQDKTISKLDLEFGRIYRIVPPFGKEIGQLKGFTIPRIMYVDEEENYFRIQHTNKSCLFIRSSVVSQTLTERFLLFHELGHSTKPALDIHLRSSLLISNGVLIASFVIINFYNLNTWSLMSCLPLLYFLVVEPINNKYEFLEELYSDLFAVEMMKRSNFSSSEFERLIKSLKLILSEKRCQMILDHYQKYKNSNIGSVHLYKIKIQYSTAKYLMFTASTFLMIVGISFSSVSTNFHQHVLTIIIFLFSLNSYLWQKLENFLPKLKNQFALLSRPYENL